MDKKTPQSDGSREHLAHTPGPWRITRYTNYEGFSICADGAGCIAERWWPSPVSDIPIEANARLIAAAPELLQELRNVTMSLTVCQFLMDKDSREAAKPVIEAARAAIAKASPLSSDGSPNKKEELPNGEQEAATVTTGQAGESTLLALLRAAKCPNCDGSGAIQRQTQRREYVSREMAKDAGDPSMEGSLYQDDEYEVEQCQWCDERNTLLALSPNHEASGSGVEDTK